MIKTVRSALFNAIIVQPVSLATNAELYMNIEFIKRSPLNAIWYSPRSVEVALVIFTRRFA